MRPASRVTAPAFPAYPVPPARDWGRRVAALAAGLVLAATATGLVVVHPWTRCGAGVERIGDECIGVTDGATVFAGPLAHVEAAIARENAWVAAQQQPSVTIAYVGPLTGDGPAAGVRSQLEGAHAAQLAANHGNFLGATPLIRLLLGNDGRRDQQWRPVVAALAPLVATEHLVAVVGLSLPSSATAAEVDALHAAGLPVVATSLPGGDLAGRGLVSVAPTDSSQVDAAVDYEAANQAIRGRGALIVEDMRPGDTYASRLATMFKQRWDARSPVPSRVSVYQSNLPDVGGVFSNMVHNAELCHQQLPPETKPAPADLPPLVYFAGRTDDLATFVSALANGCFPVDAKPYQVITGPDAANVPDSDSYRRALFGVATVTYTGRALTDRPASPSPYRAYYEEQVRRLGGDPTDEQAIVANDATWVAVNAIKGAAPSVPAVTTGAVLQWLQQLQGNRAAVGAAGRIDLDNCGSRVNEVVPIVQIVSTGTAVTHTVRARWAAQASTCPAGGGQ